MTVRSPESPSPENGLLIGAHMPTTGGVHRAIEEGAAIGCTTVQLFTSSPQQWKARPFSEEQIALFADSVRSSGVHPLIVHDSYLINLASGDDELRAKSQRAFLEEMERCDSLGIDFLVTHCGACGKESEDEGLQRLTDSLSDLHRSAPGCRTKITLEVTAGQGTCLGHRFDHFARVLDGCFEADRLRICFDTCHAFAAGYDLRTEDAYQETIREFDRLVGLDRLAVLHLNDSKKDLGSRVDRHDHIGKGFIGPEAFRLILRDHRLAHIPKIVETPDFKMHEENLNELRRLALCENPVTATFNAVQSGSGVESDSAE